MAVRLRAEAAGAETAGNRREIEESVFVPGEPTTSFGLHADDML